MKYYVSVVDNFNKKVKDYIISISSNNKQLNITTNKGVAEQDPSLCYQIALLEYEHCFKRLQRLDNKIYILITVCAFIFTRFTNAVELINSIGVPVNKVDKLFVLSYFALALYCAVNIVTLLYSLIKTLSSLKIDRFDSSEILERKMVFADKRKVIEYVIAKYEQARDKNNSLIDEKYMKVDSCVKSLKILVIALIILSIFATFVPQAKLNERTITEDFKQYIVNFGLQGNMIQDRPSINN